MLFHARQDVGTKGGLEGDQEITNINATSGTNGTDNNFCEQKPGSLSGIVYADTNGDCVRQPAEAGVGGVTITLTGTDNMGNPVNLTTTTAADGTYSFQNLVPGKYTITEAQPAGFFHE